MNYQSEYIGLSRRKMANAYPGLLKAYLKSCEEIHDLRTQSNQREQVMVEVNAEAVRVMEKQAAMKRQLLELQQRHDGLQKKYDALVEHANALNRKRLIAV